MDEYDDYCYECTGYGDDYYYDELVSRCFECPFNELNWKDGHWIGGD